MKELINLLYQFCHHMQFICQVELLLKEQQEYYLSDQKFRILEKFDLFALISFWCLENQKESINRFQVSYSQASLVIKELWNIQNKQLKKYLAARSVAISTFQQKSAIPFNQFIGLVKQQLIYANKMCKKYFTKKFINPYLNYAFPKLTSSSFILNDQVLALLQMSSPDFNGIVKQIQNSHHQFLMMIQNKLLKSQQSHNSLIIVSQQSLLFLFKNREDETQNDKFQQTEKIERSYVNLIQSKDQISLYFKDEKSFLFSLLPKYQLFMYAFDIQSKH